MTDSSDDLYDELSEGVLRRFGLNSVRPVTNAFGEVSETVKVEGDSPFKTAAVVAARNVSVTAGACSIDVQRPAEFDVARKLAVQRRVLLQHMVRLDSKNYIDRIREYVVSRVPLTRWLAKTGSGKSTVFPVALHEETQRTVLVIEPTVVLASNAHGYMRRTHPGVVALMDTTGLTGKSPKVVYTTASTTLSMYVNNKTVFDKFTYIYLDEAHDPSAEYYALRTVLFNYKDRARVIFSSATQEGIDEEKHGGKHTVSQKEIPELNSTTFIESATNSDPWHYSKISSRVLVFFNTVEVCEKVAKWYENNGVSAMVLSESCDAQEYAAIYKQLESSAGRPMVVCCTPIAETGVTLPIDTVIDLKTKRYLHYDIGKRLLAWEFRAVTEEEAKQRAGRVGRLSNGVVYSPLKAYHKFDGLDPCMKLRAYLWLKLLGIAPLDEIFMVEKSFLEPITQLGCAQLLNCLLHPLHSRLMMDDEGKYYKNFETAVRSFMAPRTNMWISEKTIDVDNHPDWFSYRSAAQGVNGGRSVQFRLPLDPTSVGLDSMLHCAVEELRWRSTRGIKEMSHDRIPAPSRANDVHLVRRLSAGSSRYSVKDEESDVENDVEEIPRSSAYKVRAPPRQVRATISKRFAPVEHQISRTPVREHRVQVWEPPPKREVPREEFNRIANDFRKTVSTFKVGRASEFDMIQPALPYDSSRDFARLFTQDSKLVMQILSGVRRLDGMDANERRRYHDSFCAVWNSTQLQKHRVDDDLANLWMSKNAFWGTGARRKELTRKSEDMEDMINSLISLDNSFRLYGFFVRECERVLHAGDPSVITDEMCGFHKDHRRDDFQYTYTIYSIYGELVRFIMIDGVPRGIGVLFGRKLVTCAHVVGGLTRYGVSGGDAAVGRVIYSKCDVIVCEVLKYGVYDAPPFMRPYHPGERVYVMGRYAGDRYSDGTVVMGPYGSKITVSGLYVHFGTLRHGCSGSPVFSEIDGAWIGIHTGSCGAFSTFVPVSDELIELLYEGYEGVARTMSGYQIPKN